MALAMASFSLPAIPSLAIIAACEPMAAHWLSMISPLKVLSFAATRLGNTNKQAATPSRALFICFLLEVGFKTAAFVRSSPSPASRQFVRATLLAEHLASRERQCETVPTGKDLLGMFRCLAPAGSAKKRARPHDRFVVKTNVRTLHFS